MNWREFEQRAAPIVIGTLIFTFGLSIFALGAILIWWPL